MAFASWRTVVAALTGLLPALTLGAVVLNFPTRPLGPSSIAAAGVPRSPPVGGIRRSVDPTPAGAAGAGLGMMAAATGASTVGTVMVAGREVAVRDGRAEVVLGRVRVALPVPAAAPRDVAYIPLRTSARSDLQGMWLLVARSRSARAEAALRRLQAEQRARLRTPRALAEAVPARRPAPPPVIVYRGAIPYTQSDELLIAHVVHSEAAGQPYLAQLGVAAVIVNRVRTPGFGGSVYAVVFAPGQFQGVGTPLFYVAPSVGDMQAASAALQGADPTDGALHFFNPAMTWAGSPMFDLPVTATYGAFRFTR